MKRFWKRPVVAAVAASMSITSAVPAMGMDGDTNTAVVAEAYEDETEEKTDESENKTETYTQDTEDEENITVMSAPEEEGFVIENGVLKSYTGAAEEITIPDTVTTVGDGENGFLNGNESVKKVIIGSSVTTIADYAFKGAAKVTDIDMTGAVSLESIGEKAFYTAHKVTGITIPEGVTAIGANAFAGTSGLRSVNFPSTVTEFGTGTIGDLFCFSNGGASHQSIMDINIADGNSLYRTDNGIVYSADGKKLVYCSGNKTDISIADGTETIAANAFYMTKAASVEIPGSVTDIEDHAFYSSSIKSLILNEGLETIGSDAFGECYANMEIVFPSTLTKINSGAFDSIGGKVTFLNKDTKMTSGAFATYKALEVVGYKDSTAEAMYNSVKESKGDSCKWTFTEYSATEEVKPTAIELNTSTISLAIGENTKLTATVAPENADNKTVSWSASPEGIVTVDENGRVTAAAEGKAIITAETVNGITATCNVTVTAESDFVIENGVLKAYKGTAETVTIPETVKVIGDGESYIFGMGSSVKKVIIPDSVTAIADYAFGYATKLETVEFSKSGNLKTIGSGAFNIASAITSLEIPEGVTEIGTRAFVGTHALTTIYLPSTLEKFGDSTQPLYIMFANSSGSGHQSLAAVNVADGCTLFKSVDGVLYSTDGKKLLFCPQARKQAVTVADGTETIASSAFAKGKTTSVILNEGLKTIESSAFSGSGIVDLTLPSTVKTIGKSAFFNSKLTGITLNEGLETIGNSAFSVTGIAGLDIPGSVTLVGGDILDFESTSGKDCWIKVNGENTVLTDGFISYSYPSRGVTIYGKAGSTAETYVKDKQEKYGNKCVLKFALLEEHTKLISISVYPESKTLKRNESVQLTVSFNPEGYTGANVSYVSGNKAVATVSAKGIVTGVQPGSTVITVYADGKTAECAITVVKEEGESDFTVNSDGYITGFIGEDISNLVIPAEVNGTAVTGIADEAFKGNKEIKSVTIPGNVKYIGKDAFNGSVNIKTVTMEEGVATIGEGAFGAISGLTSIVLPDSVSAIPDRCFMSCAKLSSVTLPKSNLKTIGKSAFRGCSSLKAITLPEGLVSIDSQAFLMCPLSTIHIPSTTTKLGDKYVDVFDDGENVYPDKNMKTITVADGNKAYSSYDGLLYNADGTEVIFCPRGATEATVRNGATAIGDYAFFVCFDLEKAVIPEGVKTIGANAFHYCEGLKTCVLPESLVTVKTAGFFGCESWEDVIIPAGVKEIGSYGFAECAASKIIIPEGIERIEEFAFWGYENLTELELPSTLKYIGKSAFAWADLKDITIPEGVTEIGDEAFTVLSGTESIKLPSTLVKIGSRAFGSSGKIEPKELEVYIPSSVKSMGEEVFRYMGDRLTIVADDYNSVAAKYAVANGHKLKIDDDADLSDFVIDDNGVLIKYKGTKSEVVIPGIVKVIGEGVFEGAEEGEEGVEVTKVTIPASVTRIEKDAFNGSAISSVVFAPYSKLAEIGERAFAYCTSLGAIELPDSVKVIGKEAFYGSTLLKAFTVPKNTETIEEGAFGVCTGIEEFSFAENGALTTIGAKVFWNCYGITELTVPEGVTEIGTMAFKAGSGLETVNLPASLKKLDCGIPGLFFDTVNSSSAAPQALKEVNIAGGNRVYSSYDGVVYDAEGKTVLFAPMGKKGTVNIKDGAEVISKNSFSKSLADHVNMPESLKTIEDSAFYGSGICSIEIPGTVEKIGASAFYNSEKLESVTIGNGVKTICANAFAECNKLNNISIPESVERIESDAFGDIKADTWVRIEGRNTVLESGFIPSYRSITVYGYSGSTAEEYVNSFNASSTGKKHIFKAIDEFVKVTKITLNKESLELNKFGTFKLTATVEPENATHKDLIFKSMDSGIAAVDNYGNITAVSQGTVEIAVSSTDGAKAVCTVKVTDDSSVSDYFFDETTGTITGYRGTDKNLVIPAEINGFAVINIANGAFKDNNKIRSVVMPSTLKSIGDEAFDSCRLLDRVEFNKGLEHIGRRAFHNCAYLDNVVLPEGLLTMGERTFEMCEKLTNVTFPTTLKEIPAYAFDTCWRIKEVIIPEGIEVIGEGAFYECEGIKKVTLSSTVNKICYKAFGACVGAEEFIIPEGVEEIEPLAFMSCVGLKTISLPASLSKLGDKYPGEAFEWGANVLGCNALQDIVVADGNETYSSHDGLLYNAGGTKVLFCPRGRKKAVIKEGTTAIGNHTFFFCLALEDVTIPKGITVIEENAFDICESLAEIKLPVSLKEIKEMAFADCTSLTDIIIPEGVTAIGDKAFTASALKEINIPVNIKRLGSSAFEGCHNLTKATVLSNVESIGDNCFKLCENLIIYTDKAGNAIYNYAKANNIEVRITDTEKPGDDKKNGGGGRRVPLNDTKTETTPKDDTKANTEKPEFTDINGHWAEKIINEAVKTGIFSGIEKDKFGPDVDITRAMIITLLHRLSGDNGSYEHNFSDVAAGMYYAKAMAWGADKNIVSGYGNGIFAPDKNITREEVAVMIYNYAKAMGMDVSNIEGMAVYEFTDYGDISDWAVTAVRFCINAGIISGRTDGSFDPNGFATRAEAASMLIRFTEYSK